MKEFEIKISNGISYIGDARATLNEIVSYATPAKGFRISCEEHFYSDKIKIMLIAKNTILVTDFIFTTRKLKYDPQNKEEWFDLVDIIVKTITALEKHSEAIAQYTNTTTYGGAIEKQITIADNKDEALHDIPLHEKLPLQEEKKHNNIFNRIVSEFFR